MPKSVLVVDDSRVATAALRRMLQHHGLMVDAAESGEEAIEYLRSNPSPSAVFLDHMMPGMDGFQTLGAIKKDARLSTVPIVMYTSQEGESYMSQALARGAYDVLRKPLRPLELVRILGRLELLRQAEVPALPVEGTAPPPRAVSPPAELDIPARPLPPPDAPTGNAPSPAEPVIPDQTAEVEAEPFPTARGVFYALLLGLLAVWYLAYHAGSTPEPSAGGTRRVDLPVPVRAVDPAPSNAPAARAPAPEAARLLDTVTWALNLHNQYGYHQAPFDDQRLNLVRELVSRLGQADFRGALRLEGYVGEFCLARDGFGGFKVPEPQTRISECEVLKYTPEEAAALGRRQSPAFARYLVTQAASRSGIKIEIVSRGTEQPLVEYPDYATTQTAGEWNAVAQRNNRVQIFLIPAREPR